MGTIIGPGDEIAELQFFTVSGSVIHEDAAGSSISGLENVTVILEASSYELVATARTDSTGHYTFGEVAQGDYSVIIRSTPDDTTDINDTRLVFQFAPHTPTTVSIAVVNEDIPNVEFRYRFGDVR